MIVMNADRSPSPLRSLLSGIGIGRGRPARSQRKAREAVAELEARAQAASPSFRPHHYLRAAQLAAETGDPARALSLYGRAIDGHLEAGRDRAAEALCRKVLELYPDVVRTRRTLALLAVGRGDSREAADLLHQYASSAACGGDRSLLRQSLKMIALISECPVVREQAVAELRSVGDEDGARFVVRGQAPRHAAFDRTLGQWAQATQAALLGVDRLREIPV